MAKFEDALLLRWFLWSEDPSIDATYFVYFFLFLDLLFWFNLVGWIFGLDLILLDEILLFFICCYFIYDFPLYSIFWFVNATKFHRFDCRFLWVFFLYVLLWIIIFFSSLPIVFFPLIFSQAPTRVESSSEPVHVFLPRMDIQCVSARFPFDSFHNRCTWSSP